MRYEEKKVAIREKHVEEWNSTFREERLGSQ